MNFLKSPRARIGSVHSAYLKVAEGCSNMRGNSPATYLFDFKSLDDVDPQKWSQVRRRTGLRSWEILFRPRRNTAGGKILSERIKALPKEAQKAVDSLPGLSVAQKLAWLDANAALFARPTPPNINATDQGAGSQREPTEAQRRAVARHYQSSY